MKLINDDCLNALKSLESDSVDSLVTDPPAGINFMNKKWDHHLGGRDAWVGWLTESMREAYRVMKPGAHGLVWAIPRTSHWTGTALENAGFEVRDCVTHLFGSGFPKSLDISKAIDKEAGAERTDAAKQWNGWGTALKPAAEFWWLVRKPISEKTVAKNVLKWGTGGLNVDKCRVGPPQKTKAKFAFNSDAKKTMGVFKEWDGTYRERNQGRFPANLVLSHEPECEDGRCSVFCAAGMLDAQSLAGGMHSAGKARGGGLAKQTNDGALFGIGNHKGNGVRLGDSGGASRFFYCAKTSKSERNAGLSDMPTKNWKEQGFRDNETTHLSPRAGAGRTSANQNHHPTVKPQKLMSYLIKLITPPGGVVLDPFMGSGSTGCAAKKYGFNFIGIEKEPEYFEIAQKRIENAKP